MGVRYDYLLLAGPGRSGSTWLYRALRDHPAFAAPGAKEGRHYRSAGRFERARGRLVPGVVLLDAGQPRLAQSGDRQRCAVRPPRTPDPGRGAAATPSRTRGLDHRLSPQPGTAGAAAEPAESRASGGAREPHPGRARRIHGLGVDVLTIAFEAIAGQPRTVLGILARLCGAAPIPGPPAGPVNAAVAARRPALAAAGKLAAIVLRGIGANRLLQRLKDDDRVMDFFFRSAAGEDRAVLGAAAAATLERRYAACLAAVAKGSERLSDGVWFRPGGGPG